MLTWKKILCPVDFSDTSRVAMELAADLAAKLDITLELFNSVLPPMPALAEGPGPSAEVIDGILESSTKELASWKSAAEARGATKVETSQLLGPSVDSILIRALQTDCHVIVMGTHGRGFIKRALLGSVAEHTLRRAHCPVITVGPRTN